MLDELVYQTDQFIAVLGEARSSESTSSWPLPVKILKTTETLAIAGVPYSESEPLILNDQVAYFHRVNYDTNNWRLIFKALLEKHKAFSPLSVYQLVNNFCFFNSLGQVPGGNRLRSVMFSVGILE